MDMPQERAAEASEDVDGKWFSEEALHSREPSKYGKKGQFCAVKRWIQEAKEGKEINANIGKFAGGKANLKQ